MIACMAEKQSRPAKMSPEELRRLIIEAGHADTPKGKLASEVIGCARSHLYRWLKGDTPITEANALLLRSKLKPKRRN